MKPNRDIVEELMDVAVTCIIARARRRTLYARNWSDKDLSDYIEEGVKDELRIHRKLLERLEISRKDSASYAYAIKDAQWHAQVLFDEMYFNRHSKMAELRNKIKGLEEEIHDLEKEKGSVIRQKENATGAYPQPPPPTVWAKEFRWMKRSEFPSGITSAVYFVWRNGVVVYVGQSENVKNRVGKHHHAIQNGDGVGFLELPPHELLYAEAYYIGILRPEMNFPGRPRPSGV